MRSRARTGAQPPQDRSTATPTPAAQRARHLPLLLLLILPLLLGGALASLALAPANAPRPEDAATAVRIAEAVARGQEAVAGRAAEAPVSRTLAVETPPAAVAQRARAALDALVAELGGAGGTVALLDRTGRERLAAGSADRAVPILPGGQRALERVLEARSGVLVQGADPTDRSVVFAAPVRAGGAVLGALVASVPIATLAGPGAAALSTGPTARSGSDATAWTVASAGTAPASRPGLLALAALSLLAVPLVLLAGRPGRARRGAATPADGTTDGFAAAAPRPATPAEASVPVAGPAAPARRPPAYALVAPAVAADVVSPVTATAPPPAPATVAAASADAALSDPGAVTRRGRFGWGRRTTSAASVAAPSVAALAPTTVTAEASGDHRDALTGLGNQRAFGEAMDRLMGGWERNRVPFALLVIDMDGLQITNARDGHAAGDALLGALGRQVKGMLRYSDRAFRIGGDEVAVLLPHTDAAGGVQVGRRLLDRARSGEEGEPVLAFSAGAAAFPGPARDRDQLLEQARAALGWVKAHGRAGVLAYDPVAHAGQTDAEKVAQAAAVAQVIAERSLRAVFQPIVDMATGHVVGFEGLTRPGPGAPFTNPGALFEAAESVGRTVELDAACFETIAAGARAIPSDRVVTINLSPRTMEAADFSASGVLEVLRANDLEPGRVVLELTERESVMDLDRLRDNLAELQRAGVRIAADDVGAGNAGLRLLSQFRFDIVKVDLGLVQEGANSDASHAVLRSLRDLAQRWGAFVIAEGIETPAHLRVVRELGLSAGQGYLIGRPGTLVDLPPVDLDALERGELMLQNAPAPGAAPVFQPSPA